MLLLANFRKYASIAMFWNQSIVKLYINYTGVFDFRKYGVI